MTKMEAVEMFGDSMAALGRACNLRRQAIQQWPDELTQAQVDRVLGAAVRLGIRIPARFCIGTIHKRRRRG